MRPRNRIVAGILAIFTGVFGGHKLYLRDTGGFMFYIFLLMFSINIFKMPLTSIMGIFEAFKLFGMTDEEFNKRYNRGIIRTKHSNVDRRRREQLKRYQNENVKRGYESRPVKRQTVRSNPFKRSGLAKYKEFDLDGAIEDFNKGLEINPNDIALHFNIACAYSLSEKKELAFYHISKAVNLGFKDYERIMSHDDLAYVRIQPEFDSFKQNGFTTVPFKGKNETEEVIVKEAEQKDDVLLSQLNRLAELRNRGILSEDEFQLEKKKLMRK